MFVLVCDKQHFMSKTGSDCFRVTFANRKVDRDNPDKDTFGLIYTKESNYKQLRQYYVSGSVYSSLEVGKTYHIKFEVDPSSGASFVAGLMSDQDAKFEDENWKSRRNQ